MLFTGLFVTYFLLLLAIVWLKIRSKDFFEALPSVFWASMMVLPFWLQRDSLLTQAEPYQVYGLMGVAFALLIGDAWGARRVQLVGDVPSPALTLLAQCALILFAGLQVIHIALLEDNLRLLFWLRGEAPGFFYEENLVLWFKSILILGTPITLALLLRARSTWLVLFFYLFSLFYGFNISLEMGVIFMVLGLLLYGLELVRFFSRTIWIVLGLIILVPLTTWWFFLDRDGLSALTSEVSASELTDLREANLYRDNDFKSLTQGDHYRLLTLSERYDSNLGVASKFYNRVLADFFLRPVESSSWWYRYFSDIETTGAQSEDPMSLFLERRELLGPANKVGIWALSRRFSGHPETTFVYTSVDADAFARWGKWGLAAAIFFVFLIRLLIKKLKVRSPWGDSLNLIVLFLLAVSLPNASGLAILGFYGVGWGILLMVLHYLLCRNYLKEDFLPASRSFDVERERF